MRRSGASLGPTGTAGLYVALLGHARLEFDGEPFAFTAPRKTLPILGYLLVHRAAAISRDFLAFTMWPDADEDVARGNLRRNLTLFKSVLPSAGAEHDWIIANNEFVRWNPDAACTLDVAEFDRQCGDDDTLEAAVALYGGDLLEDLYDDWVFGERERLRGEFLTALKRLAERFRSNRDFPRALEYAQRLLAVDPLREDVAREIAAIRYQAGDRAGALHTIDAFVDRLRKELDIDAMPETDVLRDTILRGEPPGAPSRAPPQPAAQATTRRVELPFAGREAPLERAMFAWDRAARGNGSVTFVEGEAGIGKTRFAGELASRAEQQGGTALIGATTGPESFAYQSFVEALRSAVPLIVASNLERVWQSVLATVVPELAEHLDGARASTLSPDEDKARLFESIVRALRAIARARPLLLVLEDLHWCGTATAELLGVVSHRIASERIALIVTQRTEEVVRSHPLRKIRRELEARGTNATIQLPRLERAAVVQIVESLAAHTHRAVAGRAADLYETSLGNPLFLGELIGGILERGEDAGLDGTAPPTIIAAIASRLARLDDTARRAVEIAAVAGDTFDFEVLREVTGWESGLLLDALAVLIERNVLRETTRRERGAYAFTHHLIRRAAYDAVAPERRRRYHGIVARTLAALYGGDGEEWAADLARHHEGAGEPLAAAHAWSRAALGALLSFANEEALLDASRGLDLASAHGASEPALYARLLLARIEAADRLGRRDRQAEDISALAAFARASNDGELLRHALRRQCELAVSLAEYAQADDAIAALDRQIEPDDTAWQAASLRAQARLAADRFEFERALARAGAAIALYRSSDDRRGEFETLLIAIDARIRGNRYEENRADLTRAADLAREMRDPAMEARLLHSAMVEQILKQDFPATYRMAGELLTLSRATGNRLGEARAHERRANAANRMFAVGEALDGFSAASEIYASVGDRTGLRGVENSLGTLDVALGRVERGRARLTRLVAEATADNDLRMRYFGESNVGVAAHIAGDYAEAKAHELRALDLARELGSEGFAALVLGDLGATECELGDLDAAVAYLDEAVAIHRRLDQRLDLITNQARLAVVFSVRGDNERARALAAEVGAYEQAHPEAVEDPGEVLWNVAQALHRCGDLDAANELARRAVERQAVRLAAIDRAEYRESMRELGWYRALLRARSVNSWPEDDEDAPATPSR